MMILYGGAFNPPTIAHKEVIEYLIENFKGTILVMPTQNSYRFEDKEVIDYHHRIAMLKLLTKGMERVEISDYEAKKTGEYEGTYKLLEELDHPFFVIGADQLLSLPHWIKAEEVVRENRFIVIPRNNIDIFEVFKQDFFKNVFDNFIICSGFKEHHISSSDYRINKDDSGLTPEVIKYIEENNLYK